MSTTKLPEAFNPKSRATTYSQQRWEEGYNSALEATGAKELWEALQVAMASLRTYGEHPLIEAQANAALAKIDKSGEGVKITEQWVNACIGALERALHPVAIHGATTDTEDVRHAITTLRYARDNFSLSAPAKAPAEVVEAVKTADVLPAMNAAMTFGLDEHAVVFSNPKFVDVITRTVARAVELARTECYKAALKSTNTPENQTTAKADNNQ